MVKSVGGGGGGITYALIRSLKDILCSTVIGEQEQTNTVEHSNAWFLSFNITQIHQ